MMAEPNRGGMPMSQAVDTAAAEAYEEHMVPGMFLGWTRKLVAAAAPKPGESVLDVACGTGIGARLAAAAMNGEGYVAGLDLDAGVIAHAHRLAEREGHNIDWRAASALEMPFGDASFDVCLCLQGLQFFPDRVKGLREIRRVMKGGGRLVASLWAALDANKGHQAVVQALEALGVDATAAKRACSFAVPADIEAAAREAGFAYIMVASSEGLSEFASIDSFLVGMTRGSPSTRHAVAQLGEADRGRFEAMVSAALKPYVIEDGGGRLSYPMRTQVLFARAP
jgi:SAM-dependent methyltransferase